MPAEAKPYLEGSTWSMRKTVRGEPLYVSGKSSAKEAKAAMALMVKQFGGPTRPFAKGPFKTTLGEALHSFALKHLPRLKGAPQECRRINRYMRLAGLPTFEVTKLQTPKEVELTDVEQRLDDMETDRRRGYRSSRKAEKADKAKGSKAGQEVKRKTVNLYYAVKVIPPAPESARRIPNGLHEHRAAQAANTERSDEMRRILANTKMAEVTRYQLQDLVNRMEHESSASTIHLERALLRRFFNYARVCWHWTAPEENPATQLDMPKLDNERNRTMSVDEEALMEEALRECRDQRMAPLAKLLTETAMRTSEPLLHAAWRDVDFESRVLRLTDAKTKSRNVPLSARAVEALRELQALSDGQPDSPVAALTYEALKAAWTRACERAGIEDLQLYDLRRTGATRVALKFGNIFLVQALTGHKTLQMVMRYTKTGARDLVKAWDDLAAQEQAAADKSAQIAAQVAPATLSGVAPTSGTAGAVQQLPNPLTASMPAGWAVQSWAMPNYSIAVRPTVPVGAAAPSVQAPAPAPAQPPTPAPLPSNVVEGNFARRRTA